jgi:hypothetical protein
MASLRLCGGWPATRLTVTEKDVRYTATITEYDGDGYDTDAKVMCSTLHTGEAVEVLAAAVAQQNNPAEPVIECGGGSRRARRGRPGRCHHTAGPPVVG